MTPPITPPHTRPVPPLLQVAPPTAVSVHVGLATDVWEVDGAPAAPVEAPVQAAGAAEWAALQRLVRRGDWALYREPSRDVRDGRVLVWFDRTTGDEIRVASLEELLAALADAGVLPAFP